MSPIQKKRTQLKQSTKLQITNELSTGTTVDGIVRKYNVSRRTVYNIKKRAHSIQSLDEQSRTLNCFRQRPAKYPEIEQRLLHFLSAARAMKMPVTASVIQVKARQIHHHLMQSNNETLCAAIQDFKASNGWVQKFVIRHNLKSVSLHGQAGSVDVLKVAGDISTLRQQLSAFDPNNIFNVDETGLFYRLLPRRTYILQNENRKTVRGTKNMKAKDRITGFICTNATGTLKLPVAVIGSSKEPRCFRKQTPPLPYFSQKNAWSDEPTFRKWFYTVFLPIVRKHTNSDVALIMDNCSAHGDLKDNRDQVTIFNLPPNCTALFQPMDCGVIAALKVRYRHLLLNEIIWSFEDRDQRRELAKNMTAGTKGLAEGHEPHLLDAMELVVKAWEAVSERTVIRCWIKSELLPKTVRSDMEAVYGKQNLLQSREQECLEEDLCTAFKTLRICASKEGQTDTLLDNVCNEDVIRWVNVEDNPDVQGAMLEDVCEDLVNEALLENSNDNEEEKERLTHSTIDAVAVVKPVPSSGVISKMFASLERLATDCELDRFGHLLCVAKREVLNISTRRAMERQRQTKLSEFWQ